MSIAIKNNRTHVHLLWVGFAGIVMFFAGLTSAYIVRKAEGNWLEFTIPDWFTVSTIVIVISSVILYFATRAVKSDKSPIVFILGTLALGVLFSYSQFMGWSELVNQGVYLTGEGSNPSGSFLYVITLAHLIHLLGGLIALLVSLFSAYQGKYTKENFIGLEITSRYWHFLGILWLYLFFFLI